jgi:nucleoid DNA-binding protein
MNKAELIEIAAKEADISKAAAGKALDGVMAAVVKAVSRGDSVTLVGFGTFKSAKRAARTGKNPKTGRHHQDSGHDCTEVQRRCRFQAGRCRQEGQEVSTTAFRRKGPAMRALLIFDPRLQQETGIPIVFFTAADPYSPDQGDSS